MPVRKIPKNYLGVTGGFASRKNGRVLGFESLLERDHMILLEFDDAVEGFEEQPVKIPLPAGRGTGRTYVPDVLVRYRPGRGGKAKKPLLAEVKTRKDLEKNAVKYRPKFSAARRYATERAWEFRVVTDEDIRIPRLSNLKFLREYHLIEATPADITRVLHSLDAAGGWIELGDFLAPPLCQTDEDRLATLPVIWHLVAVGRIRVDLNRPFTDRTELSLPKQRSQS